jgi:hypothetical protein
VFLNVQKGVERERGASLSIQCRNGGKRETGVEAEFGDLEEGRREGENIFLGGLRLRIVGGE